MNNSNFFNNLKAFLSLVAGILARIILQTLAVVPGIHALFFGIAGGLLFGWYGAKSSQSKFWDCLHYAILGALYSLAAALIGSNIPIKFATSVALGITWVILELQAKYKQKIISIEEENIQFSFNGIMFLLIGAIPFVGFAIFDILVKIQSYAAQYAAIEVKTNNQDIN